MKCTPSLLSTKQDKPIRIKTLLRVNLQFITSWLNLLRIAA
jgi:hypothetical protein